MKPRHSAKYGIATANWKEAGRLFLIVGVPMLLVAGLCVWFLDAAAASYFKPRYGNPLHLWARHTTDVAKAGPYFALAGGLWILFLLRRRFARTQETIERLKDAEQWALFALLSFATSGALVQGFKHIIGRKRPYADAALTSHEFYPFSSNYEFHSMPSGHAQVLFTAAAVCTAIWPRGWWFWMLNAVVFALTRVITLNHWPSDIIVGAVVGIFGTVLTYRLMNLRRAASAVLMAGVLILLAPVQSRADNVGPFGIGLIIGDPTGLSMNYRLSSQRSVDGALAWSIGRDPGFKIHSDYLWHRDGIVKADKFALDLHYGVGARIWSLSNRQNENLRVGPRVPIGIGSNFNQKALEIFTEIALVMNVIPATTADIDLGIGARVYF